MPHPNSAAYRSMVDALATGDMGEFLTHVSDEVRWWELGATSPVVGRSDLERHLSNRPTTTTDQVHDVLGNDEHVVALIHATAVVESEQIDVSHAEVLHFDDEGLVIKRQIFPADPRTALKLIGQ